MFRWRSSRESSVGWAAARIAAREDQRGEQAPVRGWAPIGRAAAGRRVEAGHPAVGSPVAAATGEALAAAAPAAAGPAAAGNNERFGYEHRTTDEGTPRGDRAGTE